MNRELTDHEKRTLIEHYGSAYDPVRNYKSARSQNPALEHFTMPPMYDALGQYIPVSFFDDDSMDSRR